jgi:hypothetical protein
MTSVSVGERDRTKLDAVSQSFHARKRAEQVATGGRGEAHVHGRFPRGQPRGQAELAGLKAILIELQGSADCPTEVLISASARVASQLRRPWAFRLCTEDEQPGLSAPATFVFEQPTMSEPSAPLLRDHFLALAARWRTETARFSSVTKMIEHPAYQEIIRMGQPVVPLILRELEKQAELWGPALTAITGARPVPAGDAGRVRRSAEHWLRWAGANGFVW